MNQDLITDILDLVLLVESILEGGNYPEFWVLFADPNLDGVIDILDVIIIIDIILDD